MTKSLSVYKKLGWKIRQIRIERKITQENLALEAGLNRAYVGYIERGERNPSVRTLAKIAKILKVQLFEFFKF